MSNVNFVKQPTFANPVARLTHVANLIESNPKEWDQSDWANYRLDKVVENHTCGAFGCAAGWGVAVTPKKEFNHLNLVGPGGTLWEEAGMIAYGINYGAANALFDSDFGDSDFGEPDVPKKKRAKRLVACLRWLATLNEDQRERVTAEMIEKFSEGGTLKPGKLPTSASY